MYYVYIIRSRKTKDFYKGLTNDIDRRFSEHNSGKMDATRNGCPWELTHVEFCANLADARKVEKYFKSGIGREVLRELFN